MSDSCLNCRFWDPGQFHTDGGDCRKRAPKLVVHRDSSGDKKEYAVQPSTAADYWCGDHEPKDKLVEIMACECRTCYRTWSEEKATHAGLCPYCHPQGEQP
jgi:hypothetical protein